jgi:chemotaxis family two-component system response regulator Rcp1
MSANVLLIENSPGDVRLTQEAFRDVDPSIHLHVASDGGEAVSFLSDGRSHIHRPACILLDLNLPEMSGREVLAHIKKDSGLKGIPTVVLSHSEAEADIIQSYQLHANCYLTKPGDWDAFERLVRNINNFYLVKNSIVTAPPVKATKLIAPIPSLRSQATPPFGRKREEIMKSNRGKGAPLEVLLVEDSPGDVRLTQEAFRDANTPINLHVASDGVEAMAFLRQEGANARAPRPDFILLDLNLPRMDGREVLCLIKDDPKLRTIPTVILTTSEAEADIVKSYQLQANCYLSKPVQLDEFEGLVKSISEFWLTMVKLPPHATAPR